MDSKFILSVLKSIHDPQKYAFFEELRIGGGFGKDSEQRFDAWSICYYPSKRNVTTCFEIKISKSDFMHEIKNPKKRRAGLRLANEFYFVTPEDLLKVTDIPVECGLIEITQSGKAKTVIKAPFRDIEPPTWLFIASICRRHLSLGENIDESFWENKLKDLKLEILKEINLVAFEWENKQNQIVKEVIAKLYEKIYNIDLQKMINKKQN
jgi:hypothetical protein